MKKILVSILFLTFAVNFVFSQNVIIYPALDKDIKKAKSNERLSVLIIMNEQIDFESLKADFNRNNTPTDKRAKTVIKLLQEQAKKSQSKVVDYINSFEDKSIEITRQFWICNMIMVETDIAGINYLLKNRDINYLDLASQGIELVEPMKIGSPSMTTKSTTEAEPGLIAINARPMWALGYTGRGKVVYNYDTGVWPDHPSFSDRYMGNFYPNEQCWYGYWNEDGPTGILNNHGTHTLGTTIGLDRNTNDTIGVAFGSYWIANDVVKGTIEEIPPVSDMVEAFEWALNPDGDTSTVSDIPNVISNSWRWRDELDTVHCEGFVVDLMNAIEAVGIANIFSGGNSGPNNTALNSPQRIKTSIVNTFCVGAINGHADDYPIVSFSTRGPSQCSVSEASLAIHPEVVAPGYNVRSAWNSNEYNSISGTSMSCPHVSGATLLLMEAFPYLPGEEIMKALYFTATDLGEPGEDNEYGMGLIDVYAAYQYLAQSHEPVAPHYAWDVSVSKVFDNEPAFVCQNTINPNVFIENLGDSTITSLTIFFSINNETADSIIWTGELTLEQTTMLTLPEIELPAPGEIEFKVHVETNQEIEEVDYHNNNRIVRFNYTPTMQLPFDDGFEDGFTLNDWYNDDSSNSIFWDTLLTSGLENSSSSAYIKFTLDQDAGDEAYLLTPNLNINQADTLLLTFDVAYQCKHDYFADTLKILASSDCGASFSTELYHKGGNDLGTEAQVTANFVPSLPDQWRKDSVIITNLSDYNEIMLAFVGVSGRGNNLFIDNVRLQSGLLSNPIINKIEDNIKIYPNPSSDKIHISGIINKYDIQIYNSIGQLIYSEVNISGNAIIDISKYSQDIYNIKFTIDDEVTSKSFVISR